MRSFEFVRASDPASAIHAVNRETATPPTLAHAQYLAGGTTLLDLMKLDVMRPAQVVDINDLSRQFGDVTLDARGLHLGAFAHMAVVADHPGVRRDYPVIAQSLQLAASAQLRNMATLGGNVLQKTRCPYYRDPSWKACNKRAPGSGCTALTAPNRNHAILGIDDSCIAQYPGDFAIALVALDAKLDLAGPQGQRTISFSELHTPAN